MITKKDILELETRRSIYDFIDKNPGLHLREISRRMNIPTTTLKYHIRCLKKLGLFEEKSEGEYKLVYVSQKIGKQEKQILSLLRQKIPCRIFLYLIFALTFSQIELSEKFGLSPQLISYHLKKLLDMGIIEEVSVSNGRIYAWKKPIPSKYRYATQFADCFIERKPVGSEKFYRGKNQEIIDSIYRVLIIHKRNLIDKNIINDYIYLLDIGDSYRNSFIKAGKRVPKKFPTLDSFIDLLLEEIFKPPFAA